MKFLIKKPLLDFGLREIVSILYVCSLERNAGKVYYNFYLTFLLMYFVSSVILQCVAVNYNIQAFKTINVSVCVCCGLILSLV